MNTKKWYASKTLWVNGLLFVGAFVYNTSGVDYISSEVQTAVLVVINVILRVVTKEEITW